MKKQSHIQNQVAKYYDGKIKQFGTTSKGVDWNGEESQILRFKQVLKIVEVNNGSLIDIGCGYGAMFTFMKNNGLDLVKYLGIDISESMLLEAEKLNGKNNNFNVSKDLDAIEAQEYVVASGLFNVKQEVSDEDWKQYCLDLLLKFDKHSTKGFSFNMLTSYSDKEFMRSYLHYADPLFFFDYCKRNFSKNVTLVHDYDLYEFTILVRK